MKRLCSICVRGGSKGVKNKNIRPLLGQPLLIYSLEQARRSRLFDYIAVSSDSIQILDIAQQWGVDYVIQRPPELATDQAAKLPAIQHCAKTVEKLSKTTFDVFVDLDATSPLRVEEDIKGAISLLEHQSTSSNVITGTPARRSPYFNLVERHENGNVALSGIVNHWRRMMLSSSAKIDDAVNILNHIGQIVFVIDDSQQLLGTITDRDLRKATLNRIGLGTNVSEIMNRNPAFVSETVDEEEIFTYFDKTKFLHLPVVDHLQRIVDVRSMNTVIRRQDAPPCFDLNASIYVWWRDSLMNSRHVIHHNTRLYVMPEERSVDIDSELDWKWVEFLLQQQQEVT